MKKLLLASYLLGIGSISGAFAQNVNIPDANFKAYLLGNTSLNTNADGEIQVSEAAAYNNQINCSNLGINDMTGIEAFTAVTSIWCNDNNLTSLDLSACTVLNNINCNNNQLTNLVVNPLINFINAENNDLSTIDLSLTSNLAYLFLQNNQLSGSLDLSTCTTLGYLNLSNNQLTGLNLANGNNQTMGSVNLTANPGLTCVTVDNAFWSGFYWGSSVDAQTEFSEDCNNGIICTVLIPDANFKAYLLGNSAINTNADSEIQCSEAEAFTGTINCSNLNIASLSGIAAFTNLTQLDCSNNPINDLSVQFNTALTHLDCSNIQNTNLSLNNNPLLTSLDCSDNGSLTQLYCYNMQLSNLNINNNTSLTHLQCFQNQLTSLDVSTNVSLIQIYCFNNQITALNLNNNPVLADLACDYNQISTLNISNNSKLKTFSCNDNLLTSLNTTGADSLKVLFCQHNDIASLDLSTSPKLTHFQCFDNQLVSLNVANGTNTNMVMFNAQQNSALECIQVDDENYSTTNWTGSNFLFDAASTFSENCGLGLEESTLLVNLYPNPANTTLNIEASASTSCKILNALGETVTTQQLNQGNNVIAVTNLKAGIYFIQTDKNQVLKFIKE